MVAVWVKDAANFERVFDSFQRFHASFAASFGRKQWREQGRNYLHALLVQAQERRNTENLSESVGISARAMQRFLTKARWSHDKVTGRLQEYLAPRLGHPEAVWVFDGNDFPKQGRKSARVARQHCGRLGKVANCRSRPAMRPSSWSSTMNRWSSMTRNTSPRYGRTVFTRIAPISTRMTTMTNLRTGCPVAMSISIEP